MSTSIWAASAVTPAGTDRIPVDVSGAGSPSRWTGQQVANINTIIGGTVTALGSINTNTALDLSLGGYFSATITGNLTFSITNVPASAGVTFVLALTNGGAFTVTLPGSVTIIGGSPVLSAAGTDWLVFRTLDGGTAWTLEVVGNPRDADLATWATITPGTGVGTALGTNVGTVGSVVVNGGALGTPSSGTLTNCTFPTLNQNTTGYAEALKSATTTVTVSAATAPTSGQVLTATSGTAATWQTPAGGTPGGSTTHVQYNNAGAFAGASDFTYSGGVVTVQYCVATGYFASLMHRATGDNATAMNILADSFGSYARALNITGAPARYAPYGLVGGAITITAGAGNTSPGTGACHGGAVNIVGGAKSDTGTDGAVNLAYTGSAARGAVKSWGAHTFADVAKLAAYTVATVPSASTSGAGATIYVSDESGGAVLAFSDATNWRRVTDRAVIS